MPRGVPSCAMPSGRAMLGSPAKCHDVAPSRHQASVHILEFLKNALPRGRAPLKCLGVTRLAAPCRQRGLQIVHAIAQAGCGVRLIKLHDGSQRFARNFVLRQICLQILPKFALHERFHARLVARLLDFANLRARAAQGLYQLRVALPLRGAGFFSRPVHGQAQPMRRKGFPDGRAYAAHSCIDGPARWPHRAPWDPRYPACAKWAQCLR